jgi:hypothetical protein
MNPANILILLDLLISLASRIQGVTEIIKKARAEGRDVTEDELSAIIGEDDVAKKALDEAIAKAKAEAPPES